MWKDFEDFLNDVLFEAIDFIMRHIGLITLISILIIIVWIAIVFWKIKGAK